MGSPVPKKKRNKKSKKDNSFAIVCQYRCIGVINVGYVSVNCTDSCFNQYHLQCWSRFLTESHVDHETSFLGNNCLTDSCLGRIFEIVWVDKAGIETSRKYVYADLNTVSKHSKQKGKGKQKGKLSRSISDASGSSERSSENKFFIRPKPPLSHSQSLDLRNGNDNDEIKFSTTTQNLATPNARSVSKSYASMVKNNNNNDTMDNNSYETVLSSVNPNVERIRVNSSEILEEILELNCPEYFHQNCKLPEKSKILSIIQRSKETDVFASSSRNVASTASSSALIFVPGSSSANAPKNNSLFKDEPKPIIDTPTQIEQPIKRFDVDHEVNSNIGQFSRIMAKHFPGYSLLEVDEAVKEVSSTNKTEDLTIPLFRKLISEHLDRDNVDENDIYMSDEDDDEELSNLIEAEECLICTELLKEDLFSLDPCGHIFHNICIIEWLNKDLTCPKCRAVVKNKFIK